MRYKPIIISSCLIVLIPLAFIIPKIQMLSNNNSPSKMKATIIKKAVLENIPSASGVEIIDGIIYIVGDDSPYLYVLDHSLKLINKVELFESNEFETGRIPKPIKPDLECMAQLIINNNKYILVMGSGSTDKRNKGFLIKLPTKYNKKFVVQPVSFEGLYNLLRSNPDIVGNGVLNLEAAATTEQHFILFNRALGQGENTAMYFQLEEFIVYLTENHEMIPFPVVQKMTLPDIKKIYCGFSGASEMDNKLFFTASAEDTPDAISDGEVLGSLVGWLNINSTDHIRGGNSNSFSELKATAIITEENGDVYKGKVEGISLYEKDSDEEYIALMVTDNDLGDSELLMVKVEL